MGAIKELAGTPQTLEASGGSISNTAAGQANDAVLDNTTELAFTCDFALTFAPGSALAVGNVIYLYLIPELDGTNPADDDTGTPYFQPDHFSGTFVNGHASGTGTRIVTVQQISIGPYKYQAWLLNSSGQTISGGWGLVAYPVKAQN